MTRQPVLGDLFGPAGEAMEQAAAAWDRRAAYQRTRLITVTGHIHRVTAVMSRLAADAAPDPAPDRSRPDLAPAWQHAAAALREALTDVALELPDTVGEPGEDSTGPAAQTARHLSAAAGYLAAGRDLLCTHFVTGPDGYQAGCSGWSAVIGSPAVTLALTRQLAAWCEQLAPLAAHLSEARCQQGRVPARIRHLLASTYHQLTGAALAVRSAARRFPLTGQEEQLLTAIPGNIPPPYVQPYAGETLSQLCEGITAGAERLRFRAARTADVATWSPDITSDSWEYAASAAAIATDTSATLLRTIAGRAAALAADPHLEQDILAIVPALLTVRDQWSTVSRHWDHVTTETRGLSSPEVGEISDLVVRLGRLTYDNPAWTPRRDHRAPPRQPAELADTPASATRIIATVHHIADVLSHLADTTLTAVYDAARSGRLYQPTRDLPIWHKDTRRYAPAAVPVLSSLIRAYSETADAASRAVRLLDHLAVAIGAPTMPLAMARSVSQASIDWSRSCPHLRPNPASPGRQEKRRGMSSEEGTLRKTKPDRPGAWQRTSSLTTSHPVQMLQNLRAKIDNAPLS